MKHVLWLIMGCLVWATTTGATGIPVALTVPTPKAWVGQRLQFYVELRAPGSFDGTAYFALPELPATLVMKIGNPIVESEEIDGKSWFVQKHEFALFSQKTGVLDIPAFGVQFSHKEGFTGPTVDVQAEVSGWKVEIQRPPGSDPAEYLITTESLDITESWEPQPGPAQVGDIFKRSISQQAPQIPGMAFMPPSTTAPEGVRVYLSDSATADQLERGDFLGKREDTLTYLLTEPGTVSLPALTYVWWNPVTSTLQSKTLPAIAVDVAPSSVTSGGRKSSVPSHFLLFVLTAALTITISLVVWQRDRLAGWARERWKLLHPPERVAERNLLRACKQNNAEAAVVAWQSWRKYQEPTFKPKPELHAEILTLYQHTYGALPLTSWRGGKLARTFRNHLASVQQTRTPLKNSYLPLLNPNPLLKKIN
ncbi:BatD family protein [Desulfosediminicola flagellatus]|uniref:BatD family protein n=1 Tax=Desulfosediminicola flagellatus TaxID=2569541 RepID=UPI0010AD2B31|nr:BatD family protein [Desulfosediminicola flagellatus]